MTQRIEVYPLMLNERQSAILAYITEHGEAKNAELLSLIGNYSTMTLWRDLSKLEQEGQIVRIRGGAVAVQSNAHGQEANFTYRAKQNISSKEEIASIAADLIHPNHAYYLDAGSTVFTLLHSIRDGEYTVVTSAANTAAELARSSHYNITLLGGQMSSSTLSCSGPQAEQMLSEMNIDVAVMATSGYSYNGSFTSGCLAEAQLKQQVIQKSAFTIMLMDHGKIGRSPPFTFATWDDLDILVGDHQLPDEFIHAAELHGVCVFTPRDGLDSTQRNQIYGDLFSKKYR